MTAFLFVIFQITAPPHLFAILYVAIFDFASSHPSVTRSSCHLPSMGGFLFSATFRKAPLEGSCRHCRLRGGSLLNFNHTGDQWSPLHTFHSNNGELQSRKLATTGRHSEILINDSKLNHTKRATNRHPYYTTIHLYESVCKSHKPKHRLTKQLCISQKQQT